MELDEALASLRLAEHDAATAASAESADDNDNDVATMPLDVLSCVLATVLAGDIVSLCTAACVCRAWRHEAAQPWLWRRLQTLPAHHAAELNLHDLALLAARSGNTLESISVVGALIFAGAALDVAYALCGPDVSVLADEDDVVQGRIRAQEVGEYYDNRDDSDIDEHYWSDYVNGLLDRHYW